MRSVLKYYFSTQTENIVWLIIVWMTKRRKLSELSYAIVCTIRQGKVRWPFNHHGPLTADVQPCAHSNQQFFPESDLRYVRVFSIANPSVVCNVRAPYSWVKTFGDISSTFCTLAILSPSCKILCRSSQGNPSAGSVKRKRRSKIERCHVRVSHLLMSFLLQIDTLIYTVLRLVLVLHIRGCRWILRQIGLYDVKVIVIESRVLCYAVSFAHILLTRIHHHLLTYVLCKS